MAKVAWVLGGGSGIGAETVKQLCQRGWTVAISGRREQPLNALSVSHGARPYPLDVTDFDAVKTTLASIAEELGKIDLVVFSVAAWEVTEPGRYDYESYAKIIDTNLLGAMRIIDPVVAQMRKQGFGEIALVASVAGYFGLPRSAAYSSGKSAMITLAETMRTELAADNISVRVICPGFVKRIADGLLNSKKFEIAFPLPFVLILKTIRLLPYPVFFALMSRLISQPSQ